MEGFKQGAQTGGLESHGKTLGFAKGGRVAKDTSGEFVMTKKGMDSMDHGVQPAREGRNQAEKEAGGTKRMLPGYKEGGHVDGYRRVMKGGKMCYMKGGKAYMMKGGKMHPYAHGGAVHAGPSGAKTDPADNNRVMSASKSEGRSKKPAGRGATHVGKGGETGKHRTGRLHD